jgi:hypothetical protein
MAYGLPSKHCGAETKVNLGKEPPLRDSVSFDPHDQEIEMDQNKEDQKQGTMTNQGQQSGGQSNPGQQAQNNQDGQQGGQPGNPGQQTQKPGQGGQGGQQNNQNH